MELNSSHHLNEELERMQNYSLLTFVLLYFIQACKILQLVSECLHAAGRNMKTIDVHHID